ncbi:MAG: NAD(+)/NADH kinase [Ruminococcaceae bacterium]|nr:NAD(+)/NADH kinase [Oscillospiraceae bacterium]
MLIFVKPGLGQAENSMIIANKLTEIGYDVYVSGEFSFESPFRMSTEDIEKIKKSDIVISVGGDGTMLKTAKIAVTQDKPVLGINTGRVGFLTGFKFEDIKTITRNDIDGLIISNRLLLEANNYSGKNSKPLTAVNDIVIHKGVVPKTAELAIFADDSCVGEYRCDGVIVSTPTGSTAYSLSAGGPLVFPELDSIIVTPICAHSLSAQGIVLSKESRIKITATENNKVELFLSVDSGQTVLMGTEASVEVKKSKKRLKLLTNCKTDFFELIRQKIIRGE